MPEVLPTRVFTKDAPCTKIDIWNMFISPSGLRRVAVVHSRSQIGLNTPKYLKGKGLIEVVADRGVEYYQLTAEGQTWLRTGLARHLDMHPGEIPKVQHYLKLLVREAPVRARPRRK